MRDADLILPDWPDLPANVGALASTRRGGASAAPYDDGRGGGGLNLGLHTGDDAAVVHANRARLQARLPGRPAWIRQVHGVAVVDAAKVSAGGPVLEGDASIAGAAGAVCAILTADCLPVLLASLDGKVVGAAHAGWRSLSGGVLQATVDAMRAAGAGEITAWMGPAIGPQAFEVGPDVLAAFEAGLPGGAARDGEARAHFHPYPGRPGKYLADIYSLARQMLARARVTRVAGGGRCTLSERDWFYSYRRDGAGSGRQASLIWIK